MEYPDDPMSKVDACPQCRRQVLNKPIKVDEMKRDGLTVSYRCRVCNHYWRTAWGYWPEAG